MEAEHQRLATSGHKRGHVRDMASTLNKPVFWTQRNAKATVPAALAEGMTTAVPAACASDLGVAAGRQRAGARDGGQNTKSCVCGRPVSTLVFWQACQMVNVVILY